MQSIKTLFNQFLDVENQRMVKLEEALFGVLNGRRLLEWILRLRGMRCWRYSR
jgi:hypothetical protein